MCIINKFAAVQPEKTTARARVATFHMIALTATSSGFAFLPPCGQKPKLQIFLPLFFFSPSLRDLGLRTCKVAQDAKPRSPRPLASAPDQVREGKGAQHPAPSSPATEEGKALPSLHATWSFSQPAMLSVSFPLQLPWATGQRRG